MIKEECCKKCGAVTEYSYYSTQMSKSTRLAEPCVCEKINVGKIKKFTGGDSYMVKEVKGNSTVKK